MTQDTEDVVGVKTTLFHLRCDIAPNDDSPFTGKDRATLIKERRDAADIIQSLSDRIDGLEGAAENVLRYYSPEREDVARGVINELRAALHQEGIAP